MLPHVRVVNTIPHDRVLVNATLFRAIPGRIMAWQVANTPHSLIPSATKYMYVPVVLGKEDMNYIHICDVVFISFLNC